MNCILRASVLSYSIVELLTNPRILIKNREKWLKEDLGMEFVSNNYNKSIPEG